MKSLINLITKSTLTKVLTVVICAGIVAAIAVPIGLNANKNKETVVASDLEKKDTDTKKTDTKKTNTTEDETTADTTKETTTSSEEVTGAVTDTNGAVVNTSDSLEQSSESISNNADNTSTGNGHVDFNEDYENKQRNIEMGTLHVQATDPWQAIYEGYEIKVEGDTAYFYDPDMYGDDGLGNTYLVRQGNGWTVAVRTLDNWETWY